MDPIEKAIRNAFEKGNAEDRDFREKVYRSAFAALDRALKANPNLTVEAAINRRKALQAKIAEIETEFVPVAAAVDPAGNGGFEPSLDDVRPGNRGRGAAAPDISIERRNDSGRRKAVRADSLAVEGERDERRARRGFRIPFGRIFVTTTVIAALGIGGWWALQTGMFKSAAQRDTSVRNPMRTTTSEDFIPENEGAPIKPGQVDPSRNWIDVFSPADAASVTAPGQTSAQVMQDASGSFLRIRSGGSDEAVLFDVGQGVLEKLAGKMATFDIIARGADGQATQMSVDCNFGELGGCGRKRYAVGYDRGDYLFELDFRSKNPGSGGTIAVNSDVGGQGKQVDVYEIRVSVSE
ncbi:hypothetical protein [Pseudaminobacter soli (ex Li et al. 2025)]|uniref:Biotin transporter BioY n=1 Tax=Pseudaminobacter soli (ex Li et al. 2025) TaxID=1295366 RepID=A0A2P7SD76_9HYPH|nr:hypothetical protein [Mesorhizobium soli]PSJ60295.1 hypothetical protein C7I85_14150 [Mesorhizobium soli]